MASVPQFIFLLHAWKNLLKGAQQIKFISRSTSRLWESSLKRIVTHHDLSHTKYENLYDFCGIRNLEQKTQRLPVRETGIPRRAVHSSDANLFGWWVSNERGETTSLIVQLLRHSTQRTILWWDFLLGQSSFPLGKKWLQSPFFFRAIDALQVISFVAVCAKLVRSWAFFLAFAVQDCRAFERKYPGSGGGGPNAIDNYARFNLFNK